MKRLSQTIWLTSILAALISWFVSINASALEIKTETSTSSNYLSASGEFAQFTLPEGYIRGDGLRVDFMHYFSNKMSFDAFLGSAVNSQSSVSSSFTGLGGYFYYTAFGNCCAMKKTISSGGAPILIETQAKKNSVSVGVGLDQFFLNGTAAVYSVSGLGVGAKYQFNLFNYNFETAARYSMMSASGVSIKGLFVSAGVVFGL